MKCEGRGGQQGQVFVLGQRRSSEGQRGTSKWAGEYGIRGSSQRKPFPGRLVPKPMMKENLVSLFF